MSRTVQLPADTQLRPAAGKVSQATSIEQSRAAAEVVAAVVSARELPRDQAAAVRQLEQACSNLDFASQAFYDVKNRGTGPSVHLAREAARAWGNFQYGVVELSRDDAAGESEVQAFAWDVETNTRSVRSFISPHARMKNGARVPLIDLNDIYLSNQNIGSRAVRECIFQMLPTWYVDKAMQLCRNTLERGDGVPLEERITNAIARFDALGITVQQLERRVGHPRPDWTGQHMARLAIDFGAITKEGIPKSEIFPDQVVTTGEITRQPQGGDTDGGNE